MYDVMHTLNPFYESIRQHRLMYIGPTKLYKESFSENISRTPSDLSLIKGSPGIIGQDQPVVKITKNC